MPDQSNRSVTSSSHGRATISQMDAMIGLNAKLINTCNLMGNNVRIIPEVTAAFKFRIHETHEEKSQMPVSLIIFLGDLLSNVIKVPTQSMQVGTKLTVGNDTILFGIYAHADIAINYHALTCGINMKLYL